MRGNLMFVQLELTGSGLPLASKTSAGLLEKMNVRQLPAFDSTIYRPDLLGFPLLPREQPFVRDIHSVRSSKTERIRAAPSPGFCVSVHSKDR